MTDKEVIDLLDRISKQLNALAILQVEILKLSDSKAKPEVLLAPSGLTHKEISSIVGKTESAVSKAISRAS